MRVAIATHTDVAAVADAPFYRTLWTDYHLRQRDSLEEIRARGAQLNEANLNALGFHEPKKLDRERQKLMSDIRARGGERVSVADIRARALELMEDIHRVDVAKAWETAS